LQSTLEEEDTAAKYADLLKVFAVLLRLRLNSFLRFVKKNIFDIDIDIESCRLHPRISTRLVRSTPTFQIAKDVPQVAMFVSSITSLRLRSASLQR